MKTSIAITDHLWEAAKIRAAVERKALGDIVNNALEVFLKPKTRKARARKGLRPDLEEAPYRERAQGRDMRAPAVHEDAAKLSCLPTSLQCACSSLRATFRRSCTKAFFAWRLAASSGARRMEEGWTVAVTNGARSDSTKDPRLFITRKDGPRRACAAVAPRQTRTFGLIRASSASSQGRQAPISTELGFWWMRFLPRGSHLKCLTTLVT